MTTERINNELNMNYPESFRPMTEEEMLRYFGSAENRWGVYDPDRHIILSVSWTKAGFWRSMTDAESVLLGIEARLRRNLLNYQKVTSYRMKLNKKHKAEAVRFEYRVNDARLVQVGDVIVIKYKKKFYVIHYITRKPTAPQDLPILKEALESVSFG